MEKLRAYAVSSKLLKKPWAKDADFLPLTSATYRTREGVTVDLAASIEDVQAVVAKALKPKRKLLTAVRFTNGRVEEVRSNVEGVTKLPEPKKPEEPKPVAAVTVARPVNGCPMPAFNEADIRANRVLETFLSPDQIEDYRKTGSFVVVGADSGHRYLICNRERPNFMRKHLGGRQMWDLDTRRAICVHDWAVPPPEEMLALFLMLALPSNETDLLSLPDIFEHNTTNN